MKTQESDSNSSPLIYKIGIAVLVLGTAILFSACGKNDLAKIQAFTTNENLPIQEASDFQTMYTDSGEIRYTLNAPKLLRFENDGQSYIEFPEGVKIVKYNDQKKIISSLKADYAKQFVKDSRWEAKNNVVVTNIEGDSLKTEHLTWDEKAEKIFTEEYVKIIRQDQVITGIGLTSDQDMMNWKIKNPKGILYVTVNNNQNKAAVPEPDSTPQEKTIPKLEDTGKAIQFK